MNLFLNETQIEWVTFSLPLLKTEDFLFLTLKGGLLIANVSVYSYLFAEIFLYVFHKRLKAIYKTIYEDKFKYIHDTCTELMDKFNLAKVEFSQKDDNNEEKNCDEMEEQNEQNEQDENQQDCEKQQDCENLIEKEDQNQNDQNQNEDSFIDETEWKNEIINETLHNTKDFVNEETRNLWIAAEKATAEKLQNLTLQEEEELKNKIKEIFNNLSEKSNETFKMPETMERICSKSCLCLNEKKIIECECHTNLDTLETVLKTNYVEKQEMD